MLAGIKVIRPGLEWERPPGWNLLLRSRSGMSSALFYIVDLVNLPLLLWQYFVAERGIQSH